MSHLSHRLDNLDSTALTPGDEAALYRLANALRRFMDSFEAEFSEISNGRRTAHRMERKHVLACLSDTVQEELSPDGCAFLQDELFPAPIRSLPAPVRLTLEDAREITGGFDR